MKKLIKPAQAIIIITIIIAVLYFLGRPELLDTNMISIESYFLGSILSLLYIIFTVIICKVLGGINDN